MRSLSRLRLLAEAMAVATWLAAPLAAQKPGNLYSRPIANQDVPESLETLTRQVSPSVVQIEVEGYGPVEDGSRTTNGLVVGPQVRTGSGTIVDVDGYIVTNARLVAGAQNIRVVLYRGPADGLRRRSPLVERHDTVEGRVVGMALELDLALLKIAVTGLRSIPIAASETVHRGQLVFAFGRQEGFRSAVTTGTVSEVALQLDADAPATYVQTNAAINPGAGGGPLVNVEGELVGVNAFTTRERGSQQVVAFAIPGSVLAAAYPRLRAYGRLRTGIGGMQVQAITPILMAGLGLPTTSGVIVSDVSPGGVADAAGIKVGDIIDLVNGRQTDSVPAFTRAVSMLGPGDALSLGVLRESRRLLLEVPSARSTDRAPSSGPAGLETAWIAQLGVVALDIVPGSQMAVPPLRIPSGVLVAARDQRSLDREVPLMTGDVIHAIDGVTVSSVKSLRGLLNGVATRSPVVLQVERAGRLRFIAVEVF